MRFIIDIIDKVSIMKIINGESMTHVVVGEKTNSAIGNGFTHVDKVELDSPDNSISEILYEKGFKFIDAQSLGVLTNNWFKKLKNGGKLQLNIWGSQKNLAYVFECFKNSGFSKIKTEIKNDKMEFFLEGIKPFPVIIPAKLDEQDVKNALLGFDAAEG